MLKNWNLPLDNFKMTKGGGALFCHSEERGIHQELKKSMRLRCKFMDFWILISVWILRFPQDDKRGRSPSEEGFTYSSP